MILAILQARISSTRLPGKVLQPILGTPMLLRQIERVSRSNTINQLIVATSNDPSDDPIEKVCIENRIKYFRGSLENVLDRFYQAALPFSPSNIVRITGDCPLIDPNLLDNIVKFHLDNQFQYTSNTIEQTFPDGLDIEVFEFFCLKKAWEEAELPSQKEHVTPFIYQNKDRFKVGSYKNDTDLSEYRWTVDEEIDFVLVNTIFEALYPVNPVFETMDILKFLDDHPHLKLINIMHKRNEGYEKSIIEESKTEKEGLENE
ncbi:cytidylyltransferase domain-containing protein [Alkalihalobacterium alkalinitrilicum]|uniref:cytidylyltransferase domain-containing protein n=1 Tax=Alkalihalobacterium alkalinitrilicum TaxID=427920 RepID=UPI0009952510|nr:glycosyltransferase family protein [Alkalihalobacterium alkalinitrilicum]